MKMFRLTAALGAVLALGVALCYAQVGTVPQTGLLTGSVGAQAAHINSAATTNSTQIKASRGVVYAIFGLNTNATTAYLKVYDVSAAPTCASSTVILTVSLVQNVAREINLGTLGVSTANGIGICITAAAADNDNAAATTGIVANIIYQ